MGHQFTHLLCWSCILWGAVLTEEEPGCGVADSQGPARVTPLKLSPLT